MPPVRLQVVNHCTLIFLCEYLHVVATQQDNVYTHRVSYVDQMQRI